jgi:hypothetical protein
MKTLDAMDQWLSVLDGPPSVIVGNSLAIAKFRAVARRANQYVERPVEGLTSGSGAPIRREFYGDALLVDAGAKAGSNDPIIPIAGGWPTRGVGSTCRRSVRGRWPAPASRWIVRRPRPSSGSTASRPTRLTPSRAATSWSRWRAAAALAMVHLSRLAEEITWWSNPRFGFVHVADAFSTGSSMMPNKKNTDPAELVRGRTASVIGDVTATLTMLKGLPLAYQRDLQEDKPGLFAALATVEASLVVMAGLIETLAVDRGRMLEAAQEGYTTATALADALVRRACLSAPPTTSWAGWSVAPRRNAGPPWPPSPTKHSDPRSTAATTRSRGRWPSRRGSGPPCGLPRRSRARSSRPM